MRLSELKGNDLQSFKEYVIYLGFSEEQYKKIYSNNELKLYDDKIIMRNIVRNFGFLLHDKGYDPEKIKRMIVYNAKLLITPKEKIEKNWNDLLKIAISDCHVSIVGDSSDFLHYSEQDIFKMVENRPELVCTDVNNIVNRIVKLRDMGYKKEDIMYMSIITPSILIQPLENIKGKIAELIQYKYTKEQAMNISIKYPSMFDMSYEGFVDRFFLIDVLNLHNVVINKPAILKQSPKLTYARYKFFLDNNITVDENNYKKLFKSSKEFFESYKITNEQLLEKYDYKVFQDEKAKIFVKREKKY